MILSGWAFPTCSKVIDSRSLNEVEWCIMILNVYKT